MKLEIRDRGAKCPRRGIPMVDVYLSHSGECWMHHGDISIAFAEQIAAWFETNGVKVFRDKSINGPLFEGVKS